MPTFYITRRFSGYSRGVEYHRVTADSHEEALELANEDTIVERTIERDDRETNSIHFSRPRLLRLVDHTS